MSIIIGDIHACYKTFKALLKKLPKNEQIYLTGDLIDRGPRSKEVIDYLIKHPEIKCVQGNHEAMLLKSLDDNQGALDFWLYYGGQDTLNSYQGLDKDEYDIEIPEAHEKYIRSLPLYIETSEIIISHSGDIGDNWARDFIYPSLEDTEKFHICGHTPNKNPIIEEKFANIDTGAAYAAPGYGTLTGIQWPTLKLFQQDYID